MRISEKLESLRNIMSRHNIDIYIVPTCDFHGSEYVGDYFKAREFISGFDGSAGTVLVTLDEALLWTDGRYFLQAGEQLAGSEFILMRMGEPNVPTVKEYLSEIMKKELLKADAEEAAEKRMLTSPGDKNVTLGLDGRMISASDVEDFLKIPNINIASDIDLIGEIWIDRPNISHEQVWRLPLEYAGMSCSEKIAAIREEMKKEQRDALVVTSLDETAWILNLRGNDVACNPVFMSFMVITIAECILFAQEDAFSPHILEYLCAEGVVLKDYYHVYDYIKNLHDRAIWIDKETANFNLVNAVDDSNNIMDRFTPALHMKSIKNETEIKNMEKAHILDGIAMTKFIYWLKHNVGKVYVADAVNEEKMSEVSLGEKLEEFRGIAESYLGPSFEPIVGYKDHGAIVHYSASEETDYDIEPEGIVLIDSGGHYLEGTTDITRTISLGRVSDKMRDMYTAVLRGNLNLAAAVFKEGCSGVALDYLARKPLWDKGMDYNHGTGHGVGYLLNVHEMPNAFRYRIMENPQLNPVLRPGMITSDEPGVYIAGEFGIRIENLILCVKKKSSIYGKFFGFKPLTLVPFDKELIDREQMTSEECRLLDDYHRIVYEKISPYLEKDEQKWLREVCAVSDCGAKEFGIYVVVE